ncbi:unnamed protein product [Amoebophrya sp. A25]|nr:unnamed protein product [Amoebophrya sp. A25]|eukprot:GSA25T00024696001.1
MKIFSFDRRFSAPGDKGFFIEFFCGPTRVPICLHFTALFNFVFVVASFLTEMKSASAESAAPLGEDGTELTFECSSRDVGRIIGTKGTNIRGLEHGAHPCRIKTPAKNEQSGGDQNGGALMVVVRITGGTRELRQRCKEAIDAVLMGSDPSDVYAEMDGAAVMRNLDPVVLNFLGKRKKDLERKHKVRLELEAKSLRIWSTGQGGGGSSSSSSKRGADRAGDPKSVMSEEVEAAKAAIEHEIDELQTSDTIVVRVPADRVGSIINHTSLRQLQDSSHIQCMVTKDDQGTGIRLVGLKGAIEEGRSCIEKLMGGEGADFLSFFPGLLSKMSKQADGDFRRDVRSMAEWCQVAVDIEPSRLTFAGSSENVDYAKREGMKILGYYFPQNCCRVDLEYDSVDYIAGEDDRNLMRLQQMGASVALDRTACYVWVTALLPRNVDAVRKRVEDLQTAWGELFQVVTVRDRGDISKILGNQGAIARQIQDETGAKLEVDRRELKIRITGNTKESVQKARSQVLAKLGAGGGGRRRGADNDASWGGAWPTEGATSLKPDDDDDGWGAGPPKNQTLSNIKRGKKGPSAWG